MGDLNIHEATKRLGYKTTGRTRQLLGSGKLRGRKRREVIGGVPTGTEIWVVSEKEVERFLERYRSRKAINTELTDDQRARLERVNREKLTPEDWEIIHALHEEGVSIRVFMEHLGMARDALATRFRRRRLLRLKEAS